MLRIIFLVSIFAFALVLPALAVDYSTDSVTRIKNMSERVSKMYFSGDKWRIESQEKAIKSIIIYRKDKKVSWVIMPDKKMYMENPIKTDELVGRTADKFPGEVVRKHLGKEKVAGLICDKYLITYKTNKSQSMYFWISGDLPVKSAAVDGSWSSELRNIKMGRQPAALFELPRGYKKFVMPSLGGGAMKGTQLKMLQDLQKKMR